MNIYSRVGNARRNNEICEQMNLKNNGYIEREEGIQETDLM